MEVITILPFAAAVVVGVNAALIVQAAEGAMITPLLHVPPVLEKGAAGEEMELIVKLPFPVFVTVMPAFPVNPILTAPKLTGLGEADI